MLLSFNFSYLETFLVVFYLSFVFTLAPRGGARDCQHRQPLERLSQAWGDAKRSNQSEVSFSSASSSADSFSWVYLR